MNLEEVIKERSLIVQRLAKSAQIMPVERGGVLRKALSLSVDDPLELKWAEQIVELQSRPDDLAWLLTARSGSGRFEILALQHEDLHVLYAQDFSSETRSWLPIKLEWPKDLSGFHLLLRVNGTSDAQVAIGFSEVYPSHRELSLQALGHGLEIGPGPYPRILNDPLRRVRYIEKDDWSTWQKRFSGYNYEGKPKLWQNYVIDDAQSLDAIENKSLDFIFSAHVFEHLVNPLGTLERWKTKLKPGGKVIAIVPDAHNCFDLRQKLSCSEQWLAEWKCASFEPHKDHKERWMRFSDDGQTVVGDDFTAAHKHFYNPQSIVPLLKLAVEQLGFEDFEVRHTQNFVDFGFVLQ